MKPGTPICCKSLTDFKRHATETLNDMENRQQMTTNMFKFGGNTMS
jgi:hypothetical protein